MSHSCNNVFAKFRYIVIIVCVDLRITQMIPHYIDCPIESVSWYSVNESVFESHNSPIPTKKLKTFFAFGQRIYYSHLFCESHGFIPFNTCILTNVGIFTIRYAVRIFTINYTLNISSRFLYVYKCYECDMYLLCISLMVLKRT